VPSGSADDVNHNGEIRNRITQWKARPDADRLFKGVTLDSSFTRYGYTTTLFGPFDRNRVSAQQTQSGR